LWRAVVQPRGHLRCERPAGSKGNNLHKFLAAASLLDRIFCLFHFGSMQMNKFARLLLASLFGTALIASPMAVSAKEGQHPNAGWCKSGKKVFDVKNCKENGGKK
jgi:hypothetical protein